MAGRKQTGMCLCLQSYEIETGKRHYAIFAINNVKTSKKISKKSFATTYETSSSQVVYNLFVMV
jgi:hypothetical protein